MSAPFTRTLNAHLYLLSLDVRDDPATAAMAAACAAIPFWAGVGRRRGWRGHARTRMFMSRMMRRIRSHDQGYVVMPGEPIASHPLESLDATIHETLGRLGLTHSPESS